MVKVDADVTLKMSWEEYMMLQDILNLTSIRSLEVENPGDNGTVYSHQSNKDLDKFAYDFIFGQKTM